MKMHSHRLGLITLLGTLVFLVPIVACISADAVETSAGTWQPLVAEHTILFFQESDDLVKFDSSLNFPSKNSQHPSSATTIGTASRTNAIIEKVDDLFKQSCDILGMHGFMNKINVKIFSSRQQQTSAFYDLYKQECTVRAWYSHEHLTVYMQINDINAGMLAHELAHAIIDHYMIVPPPEKSAEILARYVDAHLFDAKLSRSDENTTSHQRGYSVK